MIIRISLLDLHGSIGILSLIYNDLHYLMSPHEEHYDPTLRSNMTALPFIQG